MGKQEALKRFAIDLTERARKGEIDPVAGRDEEIRQIVDILMRRRQNNPILTGEAGVGKTAVVEGFALRLAKGDVPPQLKDVSLHVLDIGLLQAGASMKGEFENRLRQVIDEVQASPKPIILFIDEAHTLIGAGGAAGTGDAANLLKPALARGKLRTIAATTWAEYKKYFEKDPALTRRFQVVQVDEPSEAKAVLMLRGVASALEKHHRVQLLDEAIEAAVRLSHRYIPARQLPDKAVSLLDTACARVAVSQHATPAGARGLPPPHRGARDRARDHRARGERRHRHRRAQDARQRRSRRGTRRAEPRWPSYDEKRGRRPHPRDPRQAARAATAAVVDTPAATARRRRPAPARDDLGCRHARRRRAAAARRAPPMARPAPTNARRCSPSSRRCRTSSPSCRANRR